MIHAGGRFHLPHSIEACHEYFTAWFKSFYRQPYSSTMGVPGWFAFIGLLLCVMILWRMILNSIHV